MSEDIKKQTDISETKLKRDNVTERKKRQPNKRRKSTYKIHIKDKRNRQTRKEQPRQLKIEKYKT